MGLSPDENDILHKRTRRRRRISWEKGSSATEGWEAWIPERALDNARADGCSICHHFETASTDGLFSFVRRSQKSFADADSLSRQRF
jgi:hypothetical protein